MKTKKEKTVQLDGRTYLKKFGFICEKTNSTRFQFREVYNEAILRILNKEF